MGVGGGRDTCLVSPWASSKSHQSHQFSTPGLGRVSLGNGKRKPDPAGHGNESTGHTSHHSCRDAFCHSINAIQSSISMSCRPSETWFPCVCRVHSGLVRADLILLLFLQLHCQFLPCGDCFPELVRTLCLRRCLPPVELGWNWKTGCKITRESQAPMP